MNLRRYPTCPTLAATGNDNQLQCPLIFPLRQERKKHEIPLAEDG